MHGSGFDPARRAPMETASTARPVQETAPATETKAPIKGLEADTFQPSKSRPEELDPSRAADVNDTAVRTGLRATLSRWWQSFLEFFTTSSAKSSAKTESAPTSKEQDFDSAVTSGKNDPEFGVPNSTSKAFEELQTALKRFTAEGNPVMNELQVSSFLPSRTDINAMRGAQVSQRDALIAAFLKAPEGQRLKQVAELLLSLPNASDEQRQDLAYRLAPSLTGKADSRAGELLDYLLNNSAKFKLGTLR